VLFEKWDIVLPAGRRSRVVTVALQVMDGRTDRSGDTATKVKLEHRERRNPRLGHHLVTPRVSFSRCGGDDDDT
jgi:hypothetical protein